MKTLTSTQSKSIATYRAAGIDIEVLEDNQVKITQARLINGFILNQKQLHERAREVFPDEKIIPVVYSLQVGEITLDWIEQQMKEFGIKRNDLIKQLAIDKSSFSEILSGNRGLTKAMKATFFYYFMVYRLNRDFREQDYLNSRLMKKDKRLKKIDDNYEEHKTFHLHENEKIYLGNSVEKKCRFCKKKEPDVTFKNIAHAIPEFVNNHTLFSYYECDSCNSKFARTIETHMADYMNPSHTISQVRGKKGVPSVRKGGEKSRIDFKANVLKVESHEGEREIFEIDELNNTVNLKAIRSTYIPIAIYKCLTKMALTIIDESELINYEDTLEWINEEKHDDSRFRLTDLKCIFSFTPGPLPYEFTTCTVFKRKDNHIDNVPYMIFLLAYGNYTFQIYLPMSKKDEGEINFISIPTPYDYENKFGPKKYNILDFSSTQKVKNEEVNLPLKFDSIKKKDLRSSGDKID